MKNGLALSGGGMKIFAHIGALKALEELNIKFDYISGTSSGSIIALLYSIGMKADDMFKLVSEKYSDIIEIKTGQIIASAFKSLIKNELTLNSLIDGIKLEKMVKEVLIQNDIDYSEMNDINKNLAIISCDTISTKEIVFLSKDYNFKNTNRTTYIDKAPICKAIRASMSFPGVFTPCDYKEYNLIDGGTVNNLPSKILKDMGADKVLGISFKLNNYEPKDSIMDIALRTADIFSILNMSVAKKYTNKSLELKVPETGLLNIDDIKKVYNIGYEQAMKNKDELINLFR